MSITTRMTSLDGGGQGYILGKWPNRSDNNSPVRHQPQSQSMGNNKYWLIIVISRTSCVWTTQQATIHFVGLCGILSTWCTILFGVLNNHYNLYCFLCWSKARSLPDKHPSYRACPSLTKQRKRAIQFVKGETTVPGCAVTAMFDHSEQFWLLTNYLEEIVTDP